MSGTMTRDELVTEICDIVGKSVSASAVSGAVLQTRVRNYLNFAQRRIARTFDWDELQAYKTDSATVANVKIYPQVTGTNNLGLVRPRDIRSIVLDDEENSWKLECWSYRKFDFRFPRPENYSTGRPTVYVKEGDNLHLFRIPDDAYTLKIRYIQWPTSFSSGSQVSDFSDKDELIITAGVMETYLALEEYADAKVWYDRFRGQLQDAQDAQGSTDWEPEGEAFGRHDVPIIGEPWLSAEGTIDDPLYGYGG